MGFQVKKAVREKIYPKIALMAPSGGGKTYSSLRLATGMAEEILKLTGKKPKILLGNTEQKRGYYYANEFDYDIVDIDAPHEPEKYVDFIDFAVEEGYGIVIIDSSSHEWEGKGGCLELHHKAGGRYQDWDKVTPRHDKFIHAIADSPIIIIATMRGKDQYVMSQTEGKNGQKSTKVEKVGVGAKQRDGFEYEFTCTFLLDQKTNTAEPFKDNTHIFENDTAVKLSEEHGKKIIRWANSSTLEPSKQTDNEDIPESTENKYPENPDLPFAELKALLGEMCKDKAKDKNIGMKKIQESINEILNKKLNDATEEDFEKVKELYAKIHSLQ